MFASTYGEVRDFIEVQHILLQRSVLIFVAGPEVPSMRLVGSRCVGHFVDQLGLGSG